MFPRVVATDLDGTIVRSDGTVSQRTIEAFRTAEDAGATVVLVTGRPPRWMHPVAHVTDHRGLAICANGAIVYDLESLTVRESFEIDVELLQECVRRLSEALPDLAYAVECGTQFVHERRYWSPWGLDDRDARVADELADLWARPAAKLVARHPSLDADALLARGREILGDVVSVTHANGRGLLEVGPVGVSKATTLALLCDELGASADDVIAFGDMPNDLPMLTWAGTAYAVANAHPTLLEAIELRAPSNDDDGVAQVLEEVFADAPVVS